MIYSNYRIFTDKTTLTDLVYPNQITEIKQFDGKKIGYYHLYMGFDIETTTTPNHNGYMYHWQFSLNDDVICGRKWQEFTSFIDWLEYTLHLSDDLRVIIWVANLGFEFQFIRKLFNITSVFAREVRQPLKVVIDNCIELRDCLAISGGSLDNLAKTYCHTQKMKGDLDYTIQRNSTTPLTEKELHYCYNDVIILSEFSKYIFDNYIIPDKYIPMTKTGLLRRQVKKGCGKKIKYAVRDAYPDFTLYNELMLYCFRGGFVHANIFYCDEKLTGITSYDITSSYPSRMNLSDFPKSKFYRVPPDDVYKYINTHCCIIWATFENFTASTPHTIESVSKVKEISNHKCIENGRIRYAESVTVCITNIDLKIYHMFYTWDKMTVHKLLIAKKGKLPNYVINPMNKAYIDKDKLKREGKQHTTEYGLAKNYLNSAYGMLVTRMAVNEIIYDNDTNEWGIDSESFNYEENVKRAFLLPQWGIFVTAWARYSVLSTIYRIEKRAMKMGIKKGCVVYCDTDSIKLVHAEYFTDIIQNYNDNIDHEVFNFCKTNQLDYNIFNNLGKFDLEYTNCSGKFLGAKRYIITDQQGKTDVTIAGLPKHALQNFCEDNNADIYDVFSDGMIMLSEYALKNAHSYNDKKHTDIVDGELMCEESSIGIYPIEFTLTLDKVFLLDILSRKEKDYKYESRIY